MEFIKTILIVLALIILALLIYAAMKPKAFRLERSTNIKASPEKVFSLINDFRQWSDWSPWDKIDPGLKRTYSGAPSGVGTAYAWQGNKKVGEGRMEIIQSVPSKLISLKLDFLKPFEAHNITDFTFTPQGAETNVKWAMHGPQPFMARLMTIFFNMEKMVGPDFEKGLASMKALAEK